MKDISQLINAGKLDEAAELLKGQLSANDSDDNAWYQLGRIYWRMGRHGEAISAYQHAKMLNPQSPAAIALEMASDVMDFFNPDMLNP